MDGQRQRCASFLVMLRSKRKFDRSTCEETQDASVKKQRKKQANEAPLPWKEVEIPDSMLSMAQERGFCGLEELDGEVWMASQAMGTDTPAAVPHLPKETEKKKKKKEKEKKKEKKEKREKTATKTEKDDKHRVDDRQSLSNKTSDRVDVGAWKKLGVTFHPTVLQALESLGFETPTPIQRAAIPAAICGWKDVIGAAETGSGKTLAFALPIVQRLMELYEPSPLTGPQALILCPTRELALQVVQHVSAVMRFTPLQAIGIVGGMSQQKQERLLSRRPAIVVGTPGRLWDMMAEDVPFLNDLSSLRFVVIDEADRMVDAGHFQELDSIVARVSFSKNEDTERRVSKRQIFLFSATLTLPRSERNVKYAARTTGRSPLEVLVDKIEFRGKPCVLDLTGEKKTVSTLVEEAVECSQKDKDIYLYYFLVHNPGRTIVFVNSITCLKRLMALFTLLRFPVVGLHANMEQRQRLKNLDRFRTNDKAVCIATDVAARGLDVYDVQSIIHYQIPRTADTYIHRSGRTARAMKGGRSVAFVAAEEHQAYKRICHILHRPEGLPSMDVDATYLSSIHTRMTLARQLDAQLNAINKVRSKNSWFERAATEAEMDLDDELLEDLGNPREQKRRQQKIDLMKSELTELLNQPLVPRGYSVKYPTKSPTLRSRVAETLRKGKGSSRRRRKR